MRIATQGKIPRSRRDEFRRLRDAHQLSIQIQTQPRRLLHRRHMIPASHNDRCPFGGKSLARFDPAEQLSILYAQTKGVIAGRGPGTEHLAEPTLWKFADAKPQATGIRLFRPIIDAVAEMLILSIEFDSAIDFVATPPRGDPIIGPLIEPTTEARFR